MIDIIVVRGAGNRRGPDIIDPLITAVSVARERGRVEIDGSVPIRTVQLVCKHRTGLRPGLLVQVIDAFQGAAYKAKITAVDNGVEGVRLTSRLTVERLNG